MLRDWLGDYKMLIYLHYKYCRFLLKLSSFFNNLSKYLNDKALNILDKYDKN